VVEPPPVLQLGQIFTPQQMQDNNRLLEESLRRVVAAEDKLANRYLNKDDLAKVELVKNFRLQAEQKQREKDLAAAVSLAKRAEALANDLLERLR
jgi:hypothetical protein